MHSHTPPFGSHYTHVLVHAEHTHTHTLTLSIHLQRCRCRLAPFIIYLRIVKLGIGTHTHKNGATVKYRNEKTNACYRERMQCTSQTISRSDIWQDSSYESTISDHLLLQSPHFLDCTCSNLLWTCSTFVSFSPQGTVFFPIKAIKLYRLR